MNIKQKIIYIYFMILPFIDLITSLITRFTDLPLSLGMLVKGLTLLIGIIYTLFYSKSKYKGKSIIYLIILMVYYSVYILTKRDIWNMSSLINEVVYAFRYMYFPIMIIGLFNIFDDFKINDTLLKKILLINCITYTILLLLPYISGTGFNSYRYSSVLGTNGWFFAANETGIITIILLSSICFFLDNNKKWKILFVIPVLFSIALIGTKVSYLGMIIVTVLVTLKYILEHKREKPIIPILLIIILIIMCGFSPTISNLKGSIDRVTEQEKDKVEEEKEPQKFKYNNIQDIIPNEKIADGITVLLNGRADFFLMNYSIYSESSSVDKLFGISWSNREKINYTFDKKLIEIDYLDIFLHYGIIGFFVYYLPLIYFFLKLLKKIKKFNVDAIFYTLILILCLFVSNFAGHVLAAPSVSIYLILLIFMIEICVTKKKDKFNEKEITILALHLNFGGIEKYISSLCKMLNDNYKINIIVTYKIIDKPAFEFDKDVNITYLINYGPNKEEFKKALKEKNIKNILIEGFKSIKILFLKYRNNCNSIKKINSKYIITTRSFHSKLVGRYAKEDIIKIATEHNYHNNDNKYIKKVVNSVKKFDYFVLVSESLRDFYKQKLKKTNCIYIPNVINDLPKKFSDLKENNIINIGRLETEKAQKDLLNIVKSLKEKIKDIKLYLIGDGSLRNELENKIYEYGLEDNVFLTGFLDKEDIEKYLINSKLFVMTSYTESFGLVLIEAMSYKVPCIAYDSADGAKELLKNGNGILIKNRDEKQMVEKIIYLLNNKRELEKISEKGYISCQKYLLKNVKEEWLGLLNYEEKKN